MAEPHRINHVVVLMLENRSFDNYLGFFKPGPGQKCNNLLGANSGKSNLFDPSKPQSANNPSIPVNEDAPFALRDKNDPSHSFKSVCIQLCNDPSGPSPTAPVKNNGFVRNYKDILLQKTNKIDEKAIAEVMACFPPDKLPAINALANEFCLCDNWYCEVPGPTMPNRMYIHAATSEGYVHNAFDRPYKSKTVYELFQEAGLTWATYFHDFNEVLQFKKLEQTKDHFRRFDERWQDDVAKGNLPNYTFILPRFLNKSGGKQANSQHPPEDVRFGEHLIADVYDALAANHELWKQTALIVTYDEHGGFYDHVAPPSGPNPDGQNSPNPDDNANFKVPSFAFDRLGLRVPAIIASPWIRKGIVENRVLQHTSVIKTVTEIFELNGPLNKRDASAASFADLFQELDEARPASDMLEKLPRPSPTDAPVSFVAGIAIDPADEPLSSLAEEWLEGFTALSEKSEPFMALAAAEEADEVLPITQSQAAEFIDKRLKAAFDI